MRRTSLLREEEGNPRLWQRTSRSSGLHGVCHRMGASVVSAVRVNGTAETAPVRGLFPEWPVKERRLNTLQSNSIAASFGNSLHTSTRIYSYTLLPYLYPLNIGQRFHDAEDTS
jgi:hypothetical protein